jgi:hypothetical protein
MGNRRRKESTPLGDFVDGNKACAPCIHYLLSEIPSIHDGSGLASLTWGVSCQEPLPVYFFIKEYNEKRNTFAKESRLNITLG